MLLNSKEANARLNSPDNLLNKLQGLRTTKSDSMSVFGIPPEDKAKGAVAELDKDIDTAFIKRAAKDVLRQSLENLGQRLDEVEKPTDLSKIARDMKEVLREDKDVTPTGPQNVIIYRPTITAESAFQSVQVHE